MPLRRRPQLVYVCSIKASLDNKRINKHTWRAVKVLRQPERTAVARGRWNNANLFVKASAVHRDEQIFNVSVCRWKYSCNILFGCLECVSTASRAAKTQRKLHLYQWLYPYSKNLISALNLKA